jgi:membrane-associated phospholipid phosphatase
MGIIVRCWVRAMAIACLVLSAQAQVTATPDPVGDALRILLPLGAAGMAVYHEDMDGLQQFGLTLLVAQGTTEVLKHAIHSPRPDGTGYGFPSSHVSAVFAAAGFVQRRYGVREALPFYLLATVTAWERVHHDHHFTKDVVGGAAIGVGSALRFTHALPDGAVLSLQMHKGGPWVAYSRNW